MEQQKRKEKGPELLLPAGSLNKLKTAIQYGADAVYLGGEKFGLRARADNFTYEELKEGISFANERGVKSYVTLNSFLHDDDLEQLPPFAHFLEEIGVSALIVSDVGVAAVLQRETAIPIHLSTQASCLNSEAGLLWKKLGIKRLILGREASIYEAAMIKKRTGLEVEIFVHGAMCMAYSGHCTISNFTAGRDSNRGGCAHSCRFLYKLHSPDGEENLSRKAFFMSSKDLMGLNLLPQMRELGIDSLKIEGRMKSELYLATVAQSYRRGLDLLSIGEGIDSKEWEEIYLNLSKAPHRDYAEGNLRNKASKDSILSELDQEIEEYEIVGIVKEVRAPHYFLLEVKNRFCAGDSLEFLSPKAPFYKNYKIERMETVLGESLSESKPNSLIKMSYFDGVQSNDIARMQVKQCN